MNDMFGDRRAKKHHAIGKPFRDTAAVKRQIGDSGTLHLPILIGANLSFLAQN